MLHTTNPVIKHKAGLLNLAEELSNVSKACKIMGVSRDTFYRYRELVDEGGVDALINRSRRAPNLKNRDLLNDRVLPFYASQGLPMLRILTDRGTEYCGKVEQHDYQLYLAINDIEHTKTKAMSPQTNGICERFHKTILNEFYQVTFRKKLYGDLDTLQSDLDEWLAHYNNERTHQGKMCNGRTPMETLLDGKRIWAEKNLSQM
ncbi:helix-turn-helix domain-containing protein [Citrobacter amalonaticus]|uniref:helix-turn-helix domain-containing protein n=1 Tax=Citrobacter amalonaticus TaxID=35703 RepID=UPI0035672EF4